MSYEIVRKDEYVFEIDTRGKKFYIILEGMVDIMIRKNIHDDFLTGVK
jgi:hypothetical protein